MEEDTAPVKRRVIVCVRQGCTQCATLSRTAPDDCPYLILHALHVGPDGVVQMGRRSGKTTHLVQQANELVESDQPVYFMVHSKQRAAELYRFYGLDERVRVFADYEIESGTSRGVPPGWLFVDDVHPDRWMGTHVAARHRLVSAFYT